MNVTYIKSYLLFCFGLSIWTAQSQTFSKIIATEGVQDEFGQHIVCHEDAAYFSALTICPDDTQPYLCCAISRADVDGNIVWRRVIEDVKPAIRKQFIIVDDVIAYTGYKLNADSSFISIDRFDLMGASINSWRYSFDTLEYNLVQTYGINYVNGQYILYGLAQHNDGLINGLLVFIDTEGNLVEYAEYDVSPTKSKRFHDLIVHPTLGIALFNQKSQFGPCNYKEVVLYDPETKNFTEHVSIDNASGGVHKLLLTDDNKFLMPTDGFSSFMFLDFFDITSIDLEGTEERWYGYDDSDESVYIGMTSFISYDFRKMSNGDVMLIGGINYRQFEPEFLSQRVGGLLRINPQGEIVFYKAYSYYNAEGDNVEARFLSAAEDAEGNIWCSGQVVNDGSLSNTDRDIWLMKLGPDGCLQEGTCQDTVTLVTDVEEITFKVGELEVYPNPVQQDLNITIPEQQSGQVIIYDIEGKILIGPIAVSNQTDIHQVDVSALSSGTYIVEYVSDDRKERLVYNQKFVKI